jgi:hypothetical protein
VLAASWRRPRRRHREPDAPGPDACGPDPGRPIAGRAENGVHLAGIGDVAFGQRIKGSGGFVDVAMIPVGMRPAGYEQCEAVELAVISAP